MPIVRPTEVPSRIRRGFFGLAPYEQGHPNPLHLRTARDIRQIRLPEMGQITYPTRQAVVPIGGPLAGTPGQRIEKMRCDHPPVSSQVFITNNQVRRGHHLP